MNAQFENLLTHTAPQRYKRPHECVYWKQITLLGKHYVTFIRQMSIVLS